MRTGRRKATDGMRRRAGDGAVVCDVSARHLDLWLHEAMPVILVVYEAAQDRAYWLFIQSYIRTLSVSLSQGQETIRLFVPAANVLDERAIKEFRQYKQEALRQLDDNPNRI